jgi:single-strand DNA-binding protein
MTLNKMMIIGNLGADPELRYTPGGKAVAELRVAVNDRSKGPDGEWQEETQWFRVELWEQAAERAAERLRKGHKVFAEGALRAREWEGKDGQKRTSLEIRFARVQSLERREPGEGGFVPSEGSAESNATSARPAGAAAAARPASGEEPFVDVDDIPF